MKGHFIQRFLSLVAIVALVLSIGSFQAYATTEKIGMHILHVGEITAARAALAELDRAEEWRYFTIPLTLADLEKPLEWQKFFDQARELRVIPLVRLTTTYSPEKDAWEQPTYKDIVRQIEFLKKLNWPTDQKHIIIFNEVNHSKEWGGELDPAHYARVLLFATNWAHTEQANFVVLPAALDLAAPNGVKTTEAFTYLEQMLAAEPEVFNSIDVWNSHSYPNPGFASAPTRTGKNSLRGFEHELAFIEEKTSRALQVMITETGWDADARLARLLPSYYTYALEHIWSDERVIAVTPFLFQGSPGPFAGFSFVDANGKPTAQLTALIAAALTRERLAMHN